MSESEGSLAFGGEVMVRVCVAQFRWLVLVQSDHLVCLRAWHHMWAPIRSVCWQPMAPRPSCHFPRLALAS